MKKIGSIVIFLLVGITLGGSLNSCRGSGKVKLGFLIHSLSNARWQTDLKYLQQKSNELNAELIVRSAEGDENLQLQQAKELLGQGVKVLIVVAVNQNIAASIVREAHNFGVPVISYDRFIMNSDLDYLVSFQYEEVGKMMVDYALKTKPKGNYIFLWGESSDANAQFIKKAQDKAINTSINSTNITVLYKSFIEDWSADNTKKILEEVLQYSGKDADVVIASNSVLANASIEVLKQYGISGALVTGMDIDVNTYKNILCGNQSMTVYKPIKDLAFTAINLAVRLANNEKISDVPVKVNNGRVDVPAYLLAPVFVDKNNIKELVSSEALLKPEEIKNIN